MDLLQRINEISVGLSIFAFALFLMVNWWRKRPNSLDNLLIKVFAASAIPTGIVLLFCAFKPTLILQLTGLNIHIAVAGMALLYVSIKTLFLDDKENQSNNLE